MKKNRITILCIIFVVIGLYSVNAQKNKFLSDVEKQKQQDKQNVAQIQKKIEQIRKRIIAENKKFQVGMTWAIKHRIKLITGDKIDPIKPKPTPITRPEPKPKPGTPVTDKPGKPQIIDPEPVLAKADYRAKTFNWRDRGKVTPIRFQGLCGSCWAFASMAAYESNYLIVNNRNLDLSEQYIIDAAVTDRGQDAGSCNGGSYVRVFSFLTQYGALKEEKFPYSGRSVRKRRPQKNPYYTMKWGRVKDYKVPPVIEVKKALVKYGPITASVKVTPAFQAYTGGIFDEHAPVRSQLDTNHAIVIVGWDDNKKSYLIKNSWGKDWGEDGYMWIEYGSNNIGRGASWIIVPKNN